MIDRISVYMTDELCPYRNLAAEEYLTFHTEAGECVLFLWQNQKTVVIGRNQNCWKECRVSLLEEEGGHLARRLSGGGAVFHDLGNLNFTFCARAGDYDPERQTEVILDAVRGFGIAADRTGRNDLTVNGRKFSGNAFYRSGDYCYHHGTILVDADREQMERYLNVPQDKLRSKGIRSVKSRTVNLKDLRPELSVEELEKALSCSFAAVYGRGASEFPEERIDPAALDEAERKFASWEWKYGTRIAFQNEIGYRFAWGGIDIQLQVKSGVIEDVGVYTDAMDGTLAERIEEKLRGCRYEAGAMAAKLETLCEEDREIGNDICSLILREI